VQALKEPGERNAYSGMAMVSEWQRGEYHQRFEIELERMTVLRNAIPPPFAGQFPAGSVILASKATPPILAYTSTPFRGLEWLIDCFPRIRAAVPGARLKVFSSMKVYQHSAAEDEAAYGKLYQRCRATEGVEYIGSVTQADLARAMRSVAVLAYPNTFAETSCIGVMEAMAMGCQVVTSDLGALAETTAGFGRLIPFVSDREAYLGKFVDQTVDALRESAARGAETEEKLRRQVDYINGEAIWERRAGEWTKWLENLPPGGH
jgi:glycosyltransferase involved in cell wall biosynthesis